MTGSVTENLAALVETPVYEQSRKCPYGDRAEVLSQVDAQSGLDDTPVAVCCPNCGGKVTLFERGLPSVVPYFDTACTRCQVELRTWCAVGVDAAYLQIVEPAALTKMVQQFWDDWLWSGITNSKGEPRTEEYTARFENKTGAFGWDWEVTCPLCRRTRTELEAAGAFGSGRLDYHHWSHEPDQGVCLCRKCHDIISLDAHDTKLEEKAADWGFGSRHDLQVIRLALRDAAVTGRPVGTRPAAALVERYNVRHSPARVEELFRSLRTHETLRDRFLDEKLLAGIDSPY